MHAISPAQNSRLWPTVVPGVASEGDYLPKLCLNTLAAGGRACGGRLRIEVVISDTERVLHGARCGTCEAYYLFDLTGARLILK